jgi:hypothetical protein
MITGDLALLAASKTALAVEELQNREQTKKKGKRVRLTVRVVLE